MVKNFAEEIAGKKAGNNWVSRWLKKHDDTLVRSYSIGIDSSAQEG
jgi:hypothetical protein